MYAAMTIFGSYLSHLIDAHEVIVNSKCLQRRVNRITNSYKCASAIDPNHGLNKYQTSRRRLRGEEELLPRLIS